MSNPHDETMAYFNNQQMAELYRLIHDYTTSNPCDEYGVIRNRAPFSDITNIADLLLDGPRQENLQYLKDSKRPSVLYQTNGDIAMVARERGINCSTFSFDFLLSSGIEQYVFIKEGETHLAQIVHPQGT